MAFPGYLELSGVELCNIARTIRYVEHQAPTLGLVRREAPASLNIAVGDAPYESPMVDGAPWFDAANPATNEFFGLYPLEVQGLTDSTLSASVTEQAGDGASVDGQREASKSIRVHGLLVGSSERGVEAGLAWLRDLLKTRNCGAPSSCGGADLRFFLAEPDVDRVRFAEEVGQITEQFGSLLDGDSTSHQWGADEADPLMPARAWWTGTFEEGAGFVYGAMTRVGSTVLEASDPVFPRRRNYVPNPSMRTGLVGYQAGSSSVISWVLEGGADEAGYAQVRSGSGVTAGSGGSVFGDGVFGAGVFGGSPGSITSTAGTRLLSTSVLQPPAGSVAFSVALRAAPGSTVTIAVLDGLSSAVLSTLDVVVDDSWERYGVTAPVSSNGVQIVLSSSTNDFDADELLLERGGYLLDYFDGTTQLDGYTAAWSGATDGSESTLMLDDGLELCWPDSSWRPFITCVQGAADQVHLTWAVRRVVDLDEQLQQLERRLHGVVCTQGAAKISEIRNRNGWFTDVDFVFTAERPGVYAPAVPVSTVPVVSDFFTDTSTPAVLDDLWLYDPAGPTPTTPPTPPVVNADTVNAAGSWQRFYIDVPASVVAGTGVTVPVVGFDTAGVPLQSVRVRFHPNPFDFAPQRVDPLSYCAEFVVSYLPAATRLVVDGVTRSAVASRAGKATVPADHLLYGGGGAPMVWPELVCGTGYLMTVDIPSTASITDFAIDLMVAGRE